jgi:RES domain-containing protein
LIYTAESISLAALEILVHLTRRQLLRDSFVTIPITFDPRRSQSFDRKKLPPDWARFPPPASTQAIGLNWASGRGSAVLKVPSTIIPQEHIYLINPKHPDFAKMTIGTPKKFIVDPRLGNA